MITSVFVLDAAIIIYLLIVFVMGFVRGAYKQLGTLLATIIALLGGYLLRHLFAALLERIFGLNYFYAWALGFPTGYLIIYLVCIVIVVIAHKAFAPEKLSLNVRAIGSLLGLIQGLLVSIAAVAALTLMAGALPEEQVPEFLRGLDPPAMTTTVLAETGLEKYRQLAEVVRDPDQMRAVVGHPEVNEIVTYQPVQDLLGDTGIRQLALDRDIAALLKHPRIDRLLRDDEFRRRLEAIDLSALMNDTTINRPQVTGTPLPRQVSP